MIIDPKVPYDKINCSDEEYIVAEPKDFLRKTLGKEWRVFEYCQSKDEAEAILRAAKAEFPDKEFKIVLIKWECNEVKS